MKPRLERLKDDLILSEKLFLSSKKNSDKWVFYKAHIEYVKSEIEKIVIKTTMNHKEIKSITVTLDGRVIELIPDNLITNLGSIDLKEVEFTITSTDGSKEIVKRFMSTNDYKKMIL